MVADKSFVNVEHLLRLSARFGFGFVNGVPFLPKKLARAQENSGSHLPADHVAPLVDKDRKIAIALDPLRVTRADNGLRGRANDQWFREGARRNKFAFRVRLEPAMCHDRALLRETFHVL